MDVEKAKAPTTENGKRAPAWLGRRIGRFKLLALMGQGAMGKVFRAEDMQLQRQVALKILPLKIQFGNKTIGVEQFVREARLAASLEHPNVVQVYEVNQTLEIFYIAMELLEGGNLNDLVKAAGPMEVLRACQLGAEAAEALGHAHQLGIVHRDVKPSNLMLSRAGRCKLTDFGLARLDDPGDSYYLGTEAVGTPLYLAPEIARGEAAGRASDIYSLAGTVCFLLCGRPPFQGETVRELLDQHLHSPPPDVREFSPELPAGLAEIIWKGLAKEPKNRFATAEQFVSALRVYTIPLGGSGAIGSGSWTPGSSGMLLPNSMRPWWQKRWTLVGAGAALALIIGAAAAFLLMRSAATPYTAPMDPAPAAAIDNANPGSSLLTAADKSALIAIATDPKNALAGKSITVVGIPNSTHITNSGNMRLTFVGTDQEAGFEVLCAQSILKGMEKQFGGTNGTGIVGHKITVEGIVALNKDRPQIRVESTNQIHLAQ